MAENAKIFNSNSLASTELFNAEPFSHGGLEQAAFFDTPPVLGSQQKSFAAKRGLSTGKSSSSSRDEMNLAEFPLAVLSTRADPKVKTLEFTDFQRGQNGQLIERKWIVTAADKFGLPTSTDDDVVLGLIRISMDQGFRDSKVYFTRYELLKTLRWSTEGRSYSRLIKSLDRLSGVRIRSTNSFYDNSTKAYQTCNFGIIDAYEINDERSPRPDGKEAPKSFFIWSEMMFDSFKAGYIKKLDLNLYFSLKSAVSRRLYRYLDKHFYYKSSVEAPLFTLAFEKLGLSRSYKYFSSIKQQLEPALEELKSVGFLSDTEFSGQGQDAVVRFYASRGAVPQASQSANPAPPGPMAQACHPPASQAVFRGATQKLTQEAFDPKQLEAAGKGIEQLRKEILKLLVERGISERQSTKLLAHVSEAEAQKIVGIIEYFDTLRATNDRRISRNPVGFLYRAVESPYRFIIPSERKQSAEGGPPAKVRPELRVFKAQAAPDLAEKERSLRAEHRVFVETQMKALMEKQSSAEIGRLYAETESKMSCLKSVLDASRFKEAIDGCVREELQRKYQIPDFQTWVRGR